MHPIGRIRRAPGIAATVVALAASVIALPSRAEGPLLVPGDYPTIQEALDAAQPGAVVLVSPGVYEEQLVVSKTVTLASGFVTGGDPTLIDSTIIESDFAIEVQSTAADTTISGFTIRGTDGDAVHAFATTRILSNHIVGFKDGVDFAPAKPSVAVCVCRDNTFENQRDDAIDLNRGSGALIEDNVLRNVGDDGIEIRLHDHPATIELVIRRNLISGTDEDGIQLIDETGESHRTFLIERNVIADSAQAGLGLMDSGDTTEDYRASSLLDPIRLFNNTIVGSDVAVSGGDNLVAVNNLFVDYATIGVKGVDGGSTVAHNLFWGAGTQAVGSNVDAATTMSADPLLAPDGTLTDGSPAIDAGVASFEWGGQTVLDIPAGSYAGTAPDLGAHEYPSLVVEPETTITSGPPALTNVASATFAFESTEPGSTFECSLDGAAFAPCGSPATYAGLGEGPHTFQVRAIGQGGVDATPANWAWEVDTVVPTVTNVSSSTADGTYGIGDAIAVTVTFDEAVIVTETPSLELDSGGTASYSSGSGTSALSFTYVVGSGDASQDLDHTSTDALAVGGGTIEDAAGNAAVLTLPSPGAAGSLGANTDIVVDGIRPTVSLTSSAPETTSTSPIPVTVSFSEPVTGFAAGDVATSNGSVANLSGSGDSYTFDLVPSAAGAVTADVAQDRATDAAGNGNSAATQLSRTYAPPVANTDPTISDVADQTVAEDADTGALSVTVGDTETEAGSLTMSGSSSDTALVSGGNIVFGGSGADRTVTITPTGDASGTATITITVSDGSLTASDTFVLTVEPVNDAPVAVGEAVTTSAGVALPAIDVLANDTDPDGDPLSVTAFDAASAHGGTVSCGTTCSYTPPPAFVGADAFAYTVGDGNGGSDTAAVTITVQSSDDPVPPSGGPVPSNRPPTIAVSSGSQSVQYSDPIARVTIVGSDLETPGGGLRFGASGMPQGVTLTDSRNGSATLDGIADDAPGLYAISVTVRDGAGAQASATVSITITPEDVEVRYTGQHLVYARPGASQARVDLQAMLADLPAGGTATPTTSLGASARADGTPGDVSNAIVTFMKGDQVLCGPVPVTPLDASDGTIGTAGCDRLVRLPIGSHNVDLHVEGSYSFAQRVGVIEVAKATSNYVAGGGYLVIGRSAGEMAGDRGSRASFGFRLRFDPSRTDVRGHVNLLFVSGGSTYQVRSHDIDAIVADPDRGIAGFKTQASFTDVTDPLARVLLDPSLRVVVWMVDGGSSGDSIAITVSRGSTLVFASRWDGGLMMKSLDGGGIVVH